MLAPAASTEEPVWDWRSAVSLPACSAEKFNCAVHREREARSRFICRKPTPDHCLGPAPGSQSHPAVSPLQLGAVNVSEQPLESVPDDRSDVQPDDAVLLIVEDDPHYARLVCDLCA